MAREVNSHRQPAAPASVKADNRLYLRDEELDRGVDLILAGQRALSVAAESVRAAAGISRGELDALMAIRHGPGIDIATLRARLSLSVPTCARLVAGLDARGLITRDIARGSDRRRRSLRLTPPGEALLAPIAEAMRTALREAYKAAGPDSVAGARALLEAFAR